MEHKHKFDTLFNRDQITHMQQKPRSVCIPCTEQTIIDLHALFMTPGIHYVELETIEKGRILLEALLASLKWYRNIACITTSEIAFTIDIYDCSYDLALEPCIETFFTEHFFFDCMIIELSVSLADARWYKTVEKYVYTSTLSRHMPIIIVAYADPR